MDKIEENSDVMKYVTEETRSEISCCTVGSVHTFWVHVCPGRCTIFSETMEIHRYIFNML